MLHNYVDDFVTLPPLFELFLLMQHDEEHAICNVGVI